MSATCIFCRIARNDVPAHKLGENALALAFFDAYPLARAHTLIVPKRHVALLADLTREEVRDLFALLHTVLQAMYTALRVPATTIGVNDGAASGQTVPHAHVHILPRQAHDDVGSIHSLPWPRPRPTAAELQELAQRISAATRA